MSLTATPSGEVAQTRIGHQREPGAGQGGMGCMLRERTAPECPDDNLRELMWDSNLNCGIARKEKQRNFPRKALTPNLAHSRNKGLSKYQRRASWLHTGPFPLPKGERQVNNSQSRRQGAISAPEPSILHQTVSSLLTTFSGILDGWHLPGGSQPEISTLEESCGTPTPRKLSGWDPGDY